MTKGHLIDCRPSSPWNDPHTNIIVFDRWSWYCNSFITGRQLYHLHRSIRCRWCRWPSLDVAVIANWLIICCWHGLKIVLFECLSGHSNEPLFRYTLIAPSIIGRCGSYAAVAQWLPTIGLSTGPLWRMSQLPVRLIVVGLDFRLCIVRTQTIDFVAFSLEILSAASIAENVRGVDRLPRCRRWVAVAACCPRSKSRS